MSDKSRNKEQEEASREERWAEYTPDLLKRHGKKSIVDFDEWHEGFFFAMDRKGTVFDCPYTDDMKTVWECGFVDGARACFEIANSRLNGGSE